VFFEPLQALLQVMQHLQAEHGKFRHGEQKFLAVHHQQVTIADGFRSAEPAVLRIHQGSDAKAASWSDRFSAIFTSTQSDVSRNNTVELVSNVAFTENHICLADVIGSSLAGQGCDGLQLKIS
jgi:hypothetical protein